MSALPRLSELSRPGEPLGSEFAKYCWLLARARGDLMQAAAEAPRFDGSAPAVSRLLKSASDAGTTTDVSWASTLVGYKQVVGPFVELVGRQSVIGKLAASMRRVPFLTRTIVETTQATSGGFVGEAKPVPVTEFGFATATLDQHKAGALAVVTAELLKSWSPATQQNILDLLSNAVVRALDNALLNPATAAVSGTNPASLTYGITGFASTGNSATALVADLKALLQRFLVNGSDLVNVALVVHPTTALMMSTLNTGGVRVFADMNATGGFIWGVPVVTTASGIVSSGSPLAYPIVGIDCSRVLIADDQIAVVDASGHAALQMDNAPSSSAAQVISMFQSNMVALRILRWITWQRAADSAVEIVTNVAS